MGSNPSEGGFLKKKKIPNLKLSHTVLRCRPVRGDWCTGGWSHRWVLSGRSTSEGDFLGSRTHGCPTSKSDIRLDRDAFAAFVEKFVIFVDMRTTEKKRKN